MVVRNQEQSVGPVRKRQHDSHENAVLPYRYSRVRSASRPRLSLVISLVSHSDHSDVVSIRSLVCRTLKKHLLKHMYTHTQQPYTLILRIFGQPGLHTHKKLQIKPCIHAFIKIVT